MYPESFEKAVNHAMLEEVGPWWTITPEVEAGLIETREQRRAVGYVNIPEDRGGETKFGVAQKANPEVNVRTLTWQEAKEIYYKKYWLAGKCNQICDGRLAIMHFDSCINHGIARASKMLQEAAGADIDGIIGPGTLSDVNNSDPLILCESIADIRLAFYRRIVDRNPDQAKFLKGWTNRIIRIRKYIFGDPQN